MTSNKGLPTLKIRGTVKNVFIAAKRKHGVVQNADTESKKPPRNSDHSIISADNQTVVTNILQLPEIDVLGS